MLTHDPFEIRWGGHRQEDGRKGGVETRLHRAVDTALGDVAVPVSAGLHTDNDQAERGLTTGFLNPAYHPKLSPHPEMSVGETIYHTKGRGCPLSGLPPFAADTL